MPIFPTAVGRFELNRDFTETEREFLFNLKTRPNKGNITSENNYILKEECLIDLEKFCAESVNTYLQEIYRPNDNVSVCITQSWVNYTSKNQFHHQHTHPNSFLSGVFYINADISHDKIFFYNSSAREYKFNTVEYNAFNSDSWWLETGNGILYLFPSNLPHSVETINRDFTRISLSFNTFFKGTIGDNLMLTELII